MAKERKYNNEKKENKEKEFVRVELKKDVEKNIWAKGVFVFDTSAIGAMYSLSPEPRDKFLEVLEGLEDRIWIPARVMKEYERHRMAFLHQPISEHYSAPEFLSTHYLSKLENFLQKLQDNTFYHPCFEDSYVEKLAKLKEEVKKVMDAIRISTEDALKKGQEMVKKNAKVDGLYNLISDFKSGNPLSAREIMDIVQEGAIRYKHSIPPGYRDAEDKNSIDKFGDLIVWKEILKYAASEKKPVIFICNDVKEDWNAGDKKKDEMIPREELLDEFRLTTGQEVWFYTLNGFISNLQDYFSTHKDLKDKFDNFELILKELEVASLPDEDIKVVCDECGEITSYASDEFWWQWESVGAEERGMGSELRFEAIEIGNCPNADCGCEHKFTFNMYHYPLNVVNYVDVKAEGCKILSSPNLSEFIQRDEYECCVRCGEYTNDLNSEGFCQACMDEFDYEVNRDD